MNQKEADGDISLPCAADLPPAIPNGNDYELIFDHAEQGYQWGGPKIYLWFRMITPGDWIGHLFYMVCNVQPKGKWGPSSKYWLSWVLAAGERPKRLDRMSTSVFKNKVFKARMRVVTKTAKGQNRTPAQQYSVVDVLLEVITGQPNDKRKRA